MKNTLLISLLLTASLASTVKAVAAKSLSEETSNHLTAPLQQKKWIHGSQDCKTNEDPAIEVFEYDNSSYILRQNKCLSYEAPFIYVLVGEEKILVIDTGATESAEEFPLYQTIQSIKQKHTAKDNKEREILVVHSHSHSDHYATDSQFTGQPGVTVVAANDTGVKEFFAFENSPQQQTQLELGGRNITVIPTPGHQEEAIAIYDTQTKWLLTGDTFYPGYIYIKDWDDYRKSIARLVSFTQNHSVSAILGAHIEMTNRPGEYYDVGTLYQPEESPLPLMQADLETLNTKLNQSDKAGKITMDKVIVEPLGVLPKLIGNIAKWFIQ